MKKNTKHFARPVSLLVCLTLVISLLYSLPVNTAEAASSAYVSTTGIYGLNAGTAQAIELKTEYRGHFEKGEDHWFVLNTKEKDSYYYDFLCNPLFSVGNYTGYIYDENGTKVGSFSTSNRDQFRLKGNSTYYIKLVYSSYNSNNTYCFKITPVSDPEADLISETDVEVFSKVKYKGNLAAYYEEDWVYFYANAEKTVVAGKKYDKSWALWITAYDEDGNKLKSLTVSNLSDKFSFATEPGQKYYLCISGTAHYDTGDDTRYVLTVKSGDNISTLPMETPVALYAGCKTVIGFASPDAVVKCTYKKQTVKATADENGMYILKLKDAPAMGDNIKIWQTKGKLTGPETKFTVSE